MPEDENGNRIISPETWAEIEAWSVEQVKKFLTDLGRYNQYTDLDGG